MDVIHIIIEPVGGGAEFLVREINQRLPAHGVSSKAVFLSNKRSVELDSGEYCLGLRRTRGLRALSEVRRFLKKHGTRETIVHGHLTDGLYALAMPGVAREFPKVYTEHDTYNRRRSIPGLRLVERRVYGRYDKIVCISRGTKIALLDWLKDHNIARRVETINNGARLFNMPCGLCAREGGGLRLVSVGSLVRKKGFDIAIDAMIHLRCPIARYTIVGEGRERENLERQAAALGVAHKVEFLGWRDDIENHLHNADLQLIPSRWEGFGLVAVEGLSAGLKVVAADVPGLNDVLSDLSAAQLVEPDSPAALAKGIETVWKQKKRWHELGVVACARAEEYSLDKMVQRYSRVYADVVKMRSLR